MQVDTNRLGQFVRNFLAVCAGSYGALILSFLISIVLTRRLGAEMFGRLALLLMAPQILLLLIANWTQVGFVRNGAQEFADQGTVARTFWARVVIMVPLVSVTVLVFAAFREPLSAYLSVPQWGLALVFGHFLLVCVENGLGAVFQARQEMFRYGTVIFLEKAIALILVTVIPLPWISQPLTVIACYAASALILSTWAVMVLGRDMFLPVAYDPSATRTLLDFSLPLTLMSVAGLLGTNGIDLMLLKGIRSVSDVGLYALAGQLAGAIKQVSIMFSTLLLPHFSIMVAGGQNENVHAFVQRALPYWFFGVSALFSIALVVAGPLMPFIFGESFRPAYPAFAMLLMASSALALYNSLDPLLAAWGKTWVLAKIFLGSALVKLALVFPMIHAWGIGGAALSTVCAYWFSALSVMIVVMRRTGVRLTSMVLLASPVAVACVTVLLLEGRDYYLFTVLGVATTMFGLVNRMRLFQEADRLWLRELRIAILRSPDATLVQGRHPG